MSDNRPVGANPNTVNPPSSAAAGTAGTVTGVQQAATPVHSGPISDEAWDFATNEWLNTAMRNSAMSNATEAWNHLLSQLPELRKLLEGQIKG